MPFRSTLRNSTTKRRQLAKLRAHLSIYTGRLWPKFQQIPTQIEDTAGKSRMECHFARPIATRQPNRANLRDLKSSLAHITAGCGRSFSEIRQKLKTRRANLDWNSISLNPSQLNNQTEPTRDTSSASWHIYRQAVVEVSAKFDPMRAEIRW